MYPRVLVTCHGICVSLLDVAARTSRVLEALQLCTLLLPPANRRQLHLLLRFMNKLINNADLPPLDKLHSNRDLVSQRHTAAARQAALQP